MAITFVHMKMYKFKEIALIFWVKLRLNLKPPAMSYVHSLGCTGMHKSWKCHAPTAKSGAKTLIFWENIKIWAQN